MIISLKPDQFSVLPVTVAALAALMILVSPSPMKAETQTKVSGQVRYRFEAADRIFAPGLKESLFSLLRTRVAVDATVEDNTRLFIQFQDSRTIGGFDNESGAPVSATLNNGRNVDIHQALIQVKSFFGEGWGLMAGRFEFNLGNQRTFGAVGWDNVGRVMEGATLWYDTERFRITGWDFKAVENNDPQLGAGAGVDNTDFDIFGLHSTIKEIELELFGSYEYIALESPTAGENLLDRFSLGGYISRSNESVDITANAVLQFGEQVVTGALAPVQDISAFMLTAEVGYTIEGAGKGRVALGADVASGDDNPTDDKVNTFANLFYTGHKFRGYMDYFLASNREGLIDLMLRGKVDPTNGWTLGADIHYFSLAKDGFDRLGAATKSLGVEVDVTVATTRIKGMKFQSGLSLFFASETSALIPGSSFFTAATLADPDPGAWAYMQWVANF
ncbi:MAG: alginate export family protein [Candidatus Zixiibacteriota bacterium]